MKNLFDPVYEDIDGNLHWLVKEDQKEDKIIDPWFFQDLFHEVMDWCEEGEHDVKGKVHSIFVDKDSEEGKVWVSFKGSDLGGDDQEALDSAKKLKDLFDGTYYG